EFLVYETRSGKVLRKGKHGAYWGMVVAPGEKHLVYSGPEGLALFDLVEMKDLQAWKRKFPGRPFFTHDGKYLFIPTGDATPCVVWDIAAGRVAEGFHLVGIDFPWCFPDNKTAALSKDGKLNRVDLKTGKVVEPLQVLSIPGGLHG